MPNYRRNRQSGSMVFLTVVMHRRMRVFRHARWRTLLREALDTVRRDRAFEMTAMVLLPDHLHMLWELRLGDADFSTRVSQMKRRFTRSYLACGGREGAGTASRRRQRIRGVWEKRFWEHTIRGTRDFRLHLDYIHLNPVRHGLVPHPGDWEWSSFARYVRMGWYEPDWVGPVDLPGNVRYLWMD